MKLSSSPKIVISRTDNIGDVTLTLPLAGYLKRKYRQSQIIFLGKNYIKPLVDCCENIDKFIDSDTLSALPENQRAIAFKDTGAEVILHVFPRPEVASMASKARVRYRIGTSHRFYNWLYCNRRVNFSRKNSHFHEAQLNFFLAKPLEINFIPSTDEIGKNFGLTKIPALDEIWKNELDTQKFNLILHPLSRGSSRNWDWKNYNKLIEILPPERFKIFVTGTHEESAAITENILLYHPSVNDMTGKLSFEQLIAFIARTDGLVAASTGPLHIAAALGKRAVGLYPSIKPMHPARWAPLGPKARYLALNKECNLCRNKDYCECINTITAEQVMRLLY